MAKRIEPISVSFFFSCLGTIHKTCPPTNGAEVTKTGQIDEGEHKTGQFNDVSLNMAHDRKYAKQLGFQLPLPKGGGGGLWI